MDIRNVQKTGDMHYLYLPTAWCKAQKISAGTKVTVQQAAAGKLLVSPNIVEQKPKHLALTVEELDQTDSISSEVTE